jgi:DNA-binding response OmpR family regulator
VARILIAGDNRELRELLAFWLARVGHDVDLVPDRVEDVPETSVGRYDVVVLDCHAPGRPYADIVRAIRTHPFHGGAPIILMTSGASRFEVESALAAGATMHLDRPFPLRQLSVLVDRVLQRAEADVV